MVVARRRRPNRLCKLHQRCPIVFVLHQRLVRRQARLVFGRQSAAVFDGRVDRDADAGDRKGGREQQGRYRNSHGLHSCREDVRTLSGRKCAAMRLLRFNLYRRFGELFPRGSGPAVR
jgi:hypothetical protein